MSYSNDLYRIDEEVIVTDGLNNRYNSKVKLVYFDSDGKSKLLDFSSIKSIERLPDWIPNPGDVVFVNLVDGPLVAKVLSSNDGNVINIQYSNSVKATVELSRLKPFDESGVGLNWNSL